MSCHIGLRICYENWDESIPLMHGCISRLNYDTLLHWNAPDRGQINGNKVHECGGISHWGISMPAIWVRQAPVRTYSLSNLPVLTSMHSPHQNTQCHGQPELLGLTLGSSAIFYFQCSILLSAFRKSECMIISLLFQIYRKKGEGRLYLEASLVPSPTQEHSSLLNKYKNLRF